MKLTVFYIASIAVLLTTTFAAHATVGCTVISGEKGAAGVSLFAKPSDKAEVLHEIPLGDIVRWPDEDFAPTQAEGWAWVMHDITQETIWQNGTPGWLRVENMTLCG